MSSSNHSKKEVTYYFDKTFARYHYGKEHPMDPERVQITNLLVIEYGLYQKMHVFKPKPLTAEDMMKFHSDEYIKFLKSVGWSNHQISENERFNIGVDNPAFDGLYEFCQSSAAGSLAAAVRLNNRKSDICINWAGGFHHAKKSKASGFCYVNDIVLAILELLKYHKRVLYVDIDVHHGDGVEEAFYTTNRVMTVSFHKYDPENFFPGTGDLGDVGHGQGKYYSVNVPLKNGITDENYKYIFKSIMSKVIQSFRPSVIVLQCGADSLWGDRSGNFNLTIKGHGKCVEFIKKFNIPLLLLGGGGCEIKNVARCWTYETSIALGVDISENLPETDFLHCLGPDLRLDIKPSPTYFDLNDHEYLLKIEKETTENLRNIDHAPSVQFQDIPEQAIIDDNSDVEADENNQGRRRSRRTLARSVICYNEHSDSEDEGRGGRRNRRSYKR